MKKVISCFLVLFTVNLFSQTAIDVFCNGLKYEMVAIPKGKKYDIKLYGPSTQKISISNAVWTPGSPADKKSHVITQGQIVNININPNGISSMALDGTGNGVDVVFIDTLIYPLINEINSTSFASGLAVSFPAKFLPACATINFNVELERLSNKIKAEAKDSESLPDVLEPSFGIAFAIGPSWYNQDKPYEYYISPYDSTLRRQKIGGPSIVSSLLITWNPLFKYKKYVDGDLKGNPTGESFKAPGWFGFAAGFNFAEFNPTSSEFNLKLSGGIGVIFNLGGGFQAGLFYDITQQKVLRSDMENYLGEKYPFDNKETIDSRLLSNQPISSISIKLLYKFRSDGKTQRAGILNKIE